MNILPKLLVSLAMLPALALPACKKKKHKQETVATDTITQTFELRPENEAVHAVRLPVALAAQLQPKYTKCTGKLRCTYQDKDQTLPLTINFKTERGVATTFTVTAMMGIPVATGWVRTDSVLVDPKIGGQKQKYALARITDMTGLPADLAVLESILTGQYEMPKGFTPIAATDTSFKAYHLPSQDQSLETIFKPGETWPRTLTLRDGGGQYVIRNSEGGAVPGPMRSSFVQMDQAGKVISSVKMEAVQRKFE